MSEDKQMLVDGEWCAAVSGKSMDICNPATGEIIANVPRASAEDADRAVTASKAALVSKEWALMDPAQRGTVNRPPTPANHAGASDWNSQLHVSRTGIGHAS